MAQRAEEASLVVAHETRYYRVVMTRPVCSIRSKLVIVEGIMGSGKSTSVRRIANRLNGSGIAALGITEGVSPHPIRFDWNEPWADMPATQLAKSAAACWRTYVNTASMSERITVVDGQLFHGNLTSLFLLDADTALIRGYIREVVAAIKPLCPLLIYFNQDDVDRAIRTVAAERGDAWVTYQVDWKLGSPYAVRHGLIGLDGLIELYRHYRKLTDRLYAELDIPKISIENSGREWSKYEATIDTILMHPHGTAEMTNLD
ncbi:MULTISPECIES: hypothetical protein [Bradyrhizobium]|jgi:hypothetical protein|uniref:Deoxynucleoside kinase domain-containing protein n=2 Tax=Pseudomonadota TaxID=1224 RepID=A0ABS5G577_9BRAD|nr:MULTISPECIES: hypothetical protein [Bradyrhizobium]MBR1136439.1 hypothetical protein [Bradyrhizobium denitrificans]MDU1492881.1 hypothetical protein [Bradyrhizobium sp.]MDU1542995.1 hypothetical protein [Bradyrhizobium sp.]MDU1667087.1 hypothetical protein [Bradyrhizobium sp.]MDU1809300.1 hypothetical protein [Bradyrhizobium sp.]